MAMKLTFPQRKALGGLLRSSVGRLTPKQLHVRADVLWRLQERGLVASSGHGDFHITQAGQAAYEEAMEALG